MKPVRGAPPEPYLSDPDFTLYNGDVREVLRELPAESVDCALTSPPFFGLRDYGTGQWEGGDPGCDHSTPRSRGDDIRPGDKQGTSAGSRPNTQRECRCGARRIDRQIGLEATPDEWVSELVGVFREVRRVLRPAGTLWIECGDSYASSTVGVNNNGQGKSTIGYRADGTYSLGPEGSPYLNELAKRQQTGRRVEHGLKPKDLLGQPWMLAFALRADGWYLRQCLIWQKPNAMPESVRDRCTTGHSYVFLLAKQPRYWFDADAIAEPAEYGGEQLGIVRGTKRRAYANGREPSGNEVIGANAYAPAQKNARSVWSIPTQGYAEAHFATWPEALVERILKAGCPEWVCGTCGKPRERLVERGELVGKDRGGNYRGREDELEAAWANRNHGTPGLAYENRTVGWSDCGHGNYRPGVALDPFMGSGTTALVARGLGRHAVGVELNPDYCAMAARRLSQLSLLAEGAA